MRRFRGSIIKNIFLTTLRQKSQSLIDDIDKLAQFHPTILNLQRYLDFGLKNPNLKSSCNFLAKELPVRYANIMKELYLLPTLLLNEENVKNVQEWYEQSFSDLLAFNKKPYFSDNDMTKFTEVLDNVFNRNSEVVETLAVGIMNFKQKLESDNTVGQLTYSTERSIQYFLDRFHSSRIGINILVAHHLGLFMNKRKVDGLVGVIDPKCKLLKIAQIAYDNARFMCEEIYEKAPNCDFICQKSYKKKKLKSSESDDSDDDENENDISMIYVPSHLHHMLFELIKNAMRATVENNKDSDILPSISLLACRGTRDITIKLSDRGGGIPRSQLSRLFEYTYTTAPRPGTNQYAPMAGHGYGLPLSRAYAKYFNGKLWINSVDGYGTDAMICLRLDANDAIEILPVFNRTSITKYSQTLQVHDWTDNHHNQVIA